MHNPITKKSIKNCENKSKGSSPRKKLTNYVSSNSSEALRGLTPNRLPGLLRNTDTTTRVDLIKKLQLTQGNRAVQKSLESLSNYPRLHQLRSIDGHIIQREEDEDLDLDLDWNRYQLNYKDANVGYKLGNELYGGVNLGDFAGQLGFKPGNNEVSLSGSYEDTAAKLGYNPTEQKASLEGSHEDYRFGANVNSHGSFGASVGYGLPMLPSPEALSEEMYSGGNAASNVLSDLSNFDNPYGFTRNHWEDFKSIGGAAGTLTDVTDSDKEPDHNFGVELGVSYGPAEIDKRQQEFRIMGQLRLLLDELGGGD